MQHYFPKSEGYVHQFQDYIARGFVDRFTYQWVPQPAGPDLECPFLVTQCKRMAANEEKAFKDGKVQLDRYLPGLAAAQTWAHPIYGIVAVGRKVRFYHLVGGLVIYWRGFKTYEISTEGHIVHRRLIGIRNNHV